MSSIRAILAANIDRLMQANPNADTQAKLAARSGVAQSTIGRILRGDVSATIDNIGSIARALNVDPAQLLGNVNNRVGIVSALDNRLGQLPKSALDQIEAFVRFTINNNTGEVQEGLLIREDKAPASNHQAAIQRAMHRPLDDDGGFNLDETHAPTSRRRKTKRKA